MIFLERAGSEKHDGRKLLARSLRYGKPLPSRLARSPPDSTWLLNKHFDLCDTVHPIRINPERRRESEKAVPRLESNTIRDVDSFVFSRRHTSSTRTVSHRPLSPSYLYPPSPPPPLIVTTKTAHYMHFRPVAASHSFETDASRFVHPCRETRAINKISGKRLIAPRGISKKECATRGQTCNSKRSICTHARV